MSGTASIAIGIGCRRGTPGVAIAALVESALAAMPAHEAGARRLFTIEDKRDERGMQDAAAALALELTYLPRGALQAMAAGVETRSALVEARFGVGSVAEAAALAGAGPGARLIVPRRSSGAATCAIAARGPDL